MLGQHFLLDSHVLLKHDFQFALRRENRQLFFGHRASSFQLNAKSDDTHHHHGRCHACKRTTRHLQHKKNVAVTAGRMNCQNDLELGVRRERHRIGLGHRARFFQMNAKSDATHASAQHLQVGLRAETPLEHKLLTALCDLVDEGVLAGAVIDVQVSVSAVHRKWWRAFS